LFFGSLFALLDLLQGGGFLLISDKAKYFSALTVR